MLEMLRPASDFLLHLVECVHANDCLMGTGGMVHRFLAGILDALLRDVVLAVGFLQEQVSGICIIAEQL